jgi:CRP-like cAMP-binding protein
MFSAKTPLSLPQSGNGGLCGQAYELVLNYCMETLKRLIALECDYRMQDETMDRFLSLMTEVQLKNNQPLVSYGTLDNNIYIIRDGIIRFAYFDGLKERTFAFASSGTLIIPYSPYLMHAPSDFQLESCGKSVVMKISKEKFDEMLFLSNDFARWLLRWHMEQLWFFERKLTVVTGTAKERFEAFIKNRPEILNVLSNQVIASYIGVTPEYLSVIKKEVLLGTKE